MNKSEKFWDRISKYYDKGAKDKAYKKTLEITKKHLKSSDIVLDYACATGLFSIELAGNVKEIHGIDISSKMIDIAKEETCRENINNLAFIKGDWEELELSMLKHKNIKVCRLSTNLFFLNEILSWSVMPYLNCCFLANFQLRSRKVNVNFP